jgi:DHA2 family multidrug resistance protein
LGRRNYFLLSIAVFTIASGLCGMATSLGQIILFRVIQGLAGGGLQPSSQGVLLDAFPPEKQGAAQTMFGVAALLAPVVGPTLGGYLTVQYDWRWIFFINVPVGLLSLYLSNKLVEDPREFTAERTAAKAKGLSIDGIGIALIAIASATLEVALDRGQIDDWFNDRFITTMIAVAVFGWMGTIAWELYVKDPVVDFRLFRSRNFAIAGTLLFVFGVGLFGTTTLIPQMLQSLYGYRAIDAGLILGPGALAITFLAPISAQLLQRRIVSAKTMVFASISIIGISMFVYSSMNLDTNAAHYRLERVLQGVGYGLFLVPISVIAYSQLRPDQNNKASSMTNLLRNWGGSFGIAFVTTESARRESFHQSNLVSHLDSGSQALQQAGHALTGYLLQHGFTSADSSGAGLGVVYRQIAEQSRFLAFMDCFRVFGWITIAMIPLVLAIRKFRPSGSGPSVH